MVSTITMNIASPTFRPVATKATAVTVGVYMPKLLNPITCLENAASAAIIGSINTRTIVLAGTPSLTMVRMVKEMKLFQESEPIGCWSRSVLSGDSETAGSVRSETGLSIELIVAVSA